MIFVLGWIREFCSNCCKIERCYLDVAKEGHDAQYKTQAGKVPLQERQAPVAELTPTPLGLPSLA